MAARTTAKTELFSEWKKGALVVADQGMSTGGRLWVHSGTGVDAAHYGLAPEKPVATLDYAVGLATAGEFDIIYLMPEHAETIASAAASPNLDARGIKVIGLGNGDDRPTFTFTHVDANIIVGATNIWIENILFLNGVDNQVEMLDIDFCDCTVLNCEFREGAASQFLTAIDVNGGGANAADRPHIIHNRIVSMTAGATNGIEIGAVEDGAVIEDNTIVGNFTAAGIWSDQILTTARIENNKVSNYAAGQFAVEFTAAATGHCVNNRLYSNAVATALDPGSLMCNGNLWTGAIDQAGIPIPVAAAGVFPAGSIDAAAIANGAIDAATFAAGAIDAAAIANAAIDKATFAADTADLMGDGIVETRATGALPQTNDLNIFTVTGHCLLKRLVGVVTVDVGAVANDTLIKLDSTGAGATTDLCAALDITGDVADTTYTITGTFANAMIGTTNLPLATAADINVLLVPGSIVLECAGSDGGGGRVRWSVLYQPLEEGASIVAA